MNTQVNKLERFDFGGPPQWALVRGHSQTNPVVLLVQQGPGFPMIQDAQALEKSLHLEENFRVVYWDQRGTGKSFNSKDRAPLTIETLVGDVRSMTRALCERFGVSQIDVVGFSLGGTYALLACAEDPAPVRSLTCVGPDVDLPETERFAYAFALAEAERLGHQGALRALRAIGEPPHDDAKRFMVRVKWVTNFGGIHRKKNFGKMVRGLLARLWASPHYSLGEMLGALKGMDATQKRILPSLRGFNLLAKPLHINVPVSVFQGRHDVGAPPKCAEALAARLSADLVWFEESAHNPHEEEPQRFREELLRFVTKARTR